MVKIRTRSSGAPVLPFAQDTRQRTGFNVIEKVAQLVIKIIINFWHLCGAAALTIYLIYQISGHLSLAVLLIFAVTGNVVKILCFQISTTYTQGNVAFFSLYLIQCAWQHVKEIYDSFIKAY